MRVVVSLAVASAALFGVVPHVPPQWASPAWAFGWILMAAVFGYYIDIMMFRGKWGESQRPRDFTKDEMIRGAWYRRAVIIAATTLSWAIVAGSPGGL